MVFHAINIAQLHERVIIDSDDTDVLVILLYYCSKGLLPDFVFKHTGHAGHYTDRGRFIPIHSICEKLESNICQSLPAIDFLAGCDTTCSLFKIGKKKTFNKVTTEQRQVAIIEIVWASGY